MAEAMEIEVNKLYKDARGHMWKVTEKFPGGYATLVRQDRHVIAYRNRYVDIRASFVPA